ncbi:ATP-binding cassette domain-containing protein [Priestia flexa]
MTIEQLEMKHIAKSFESFQALQDVGFTVKKGEIHALLGANGAGKSTLMKILSGAYSEYSGNIYKNGQSVTLRSPKDAKNLGIAIVHQEVDVALVPSLTVAENIALDRQTSKDSPAIVKWKQHATEAKSALATLGSTLNVKKMYRN